MEHPEAPALKGSLNTAEGTNKKRGREEEDTKDTSDQNITKRQDIDGNCNGNSNIEDGNIKGSEGSLLSETSLGSGVFDFPWLHEGMILKSEEWNFEDTFSSSLDETLGAAGGIEYSGSGQRLCESSANYALGFLENNFEESSVAWPLPLKGDDDGGHGLQNKDCNWGSFLNHLLQQGVADD